MLAEAQQQYNFLDLSTLYNVVHFFKNSACSSNSLDIRWFKVGEKGCKNCTEKCDLCMFNSKNETDCAMCTWGHYRNSTGVCLSCIENCDDCDGPTAEECYLPAIGYFYNKSAKVVEEISVSGCDEANLEGKCERCKPNYFCDVDEFGQCTKCNNCTVNNCQYCSPSKKTECLLCNSGYKIINGECETGISSDFCIYYDYSGQCLLCLEGYGFTNGICKACPKNCLNCFQGICTTCAPYYGVNATGLCSDCSDYDKNCLTCENGVCYLCNPGYGVNYESNSCFECSNPNCLICEKQITNAKEMCITCETGYQLDAYNECVIENKISNCEGQTEGVCYKCKNNYYFNGVECLKCDKACSRCHGPDSTDCDACPVTKILNLEFNHNLMKSTPDYYPFATCVDKCPEYDSKGKAVYLIDNAYGPAYCINLNLKNASLVEKGNYGNIFNVFNPLLITQVRGNRYSKFDTKAALNFILLHLLCIIFMQHIEGLEKKLQR